MTVKSFLIGLALVAGGFSMVYKTEWYIGFMGLNDWAEAKLGGGGTRLMYKLIGIVFCFLGILGMTGQLSGLAEGAATAAFGLKK
ncbi:MAG: hypothetical protein A2848_03590 [Candidatus Magasanikbacteria bacterium RIFCSPHIGHO2_01_FULL_50_8]|uniref:DUF3784 domain-containing protein n=2 Tax=Candidatus Magasanikiibacteriota TaxID=1752731 RepID=A0A1F6LRD5_9BACT|nr:MAG: hypothetical protein A2848_03590 [Candidatus Magasanikbacteria bacterium RIFCSPHIGHO2_01_FULL_50_8]OGH67921.1 MAG: hypothetical protein A3C15_00915 [Candidatus Magasanikbacteria bacterium RIFCSPHIGHO2_02_FULL_50_9b]